nr:MAG TPA: LST-1 protein [Caudoviricetes sp.]
MLALICFALCICSSKFERRLERHKKEWEEQHYD